MENATKALLIAAGVMLSLMILSLLLVGYNQISAYYGDKEKVTQAKQLAEFNSVYDNYNRKNIRGSDLISLMNRIIDYNQREAYDEGTGYKRIEVTITIGDNAIIDQFLYSGTSSALTIILPKITNTTGVGDSKTKDKQLIAITNIETDLITEGNNQGMKLDSGKLQQLSANISIICDSYSDRNATKRKILLDNVGVADTDTTKITKLQNITRKYYQYMQFKRAYFECTNLEYDSETGRVCKMEFKVSTNSSGAVIFNQ